jgi:hypothetical protein
MGNGASLPPQTMNSELNQRLSNRLENPFIPNSIRIELFERIPQSAPNGSIALYVVNRFLLRIDCLLRFTMANRIKQITVLDHERIGRIPREDYYAERQKRWVWVFPKIDKHSTLNQIVDLDSFCAILFPHSIKKQGVSKAIIQILVEEKRPMYLMDLHHKVLERIKVSAQTLSDTYKAMLRSGLLEKKYRNEPTKLSVQFANRLKDLATYWDNYLTAKKIT